MSKMRFQKGRERKSMRNNSKRGLVVTAIGVLAFLSFIPVASASGVSGSFNESSCIGGGVTVTEYTINWSPAGTQANMGCFDTGIGSSFTYSGGTVGAGAPGNIANLTYNVAVSGPFIDFPGYTGLDFVLAGFVTPTPTNGTNCASTTGGQSCVVFTGSPFLLLNSGGTAVTLSAYGTVVDNSVTSNWTGIFTTQLSQAPGAIESTILAGGSVVSAQSAQFQVDVSDVPEPASMTLLGAGLIAIAMAARKRRKA